MFKLTLKITTIANILLWFSGMVCVQPISLDERQGHSTGSSLYSWRMFERFSRKVGVRNKIRSWCSQQNQVLQQLPAQTSEHTEQPTPPEYIYLHPHCISHKEKKKEIVLRSHSKISYNLFFWVNLQFSLNVEKKIVKWSTLLTANQQEVSIHDSPTTKTLNC